MHVSIFAFDFGRVMHCLRQIGYMGRTWFFLGLGIDILRAWKGNIISDPLTLISSEQTKVSEI